MVLLQGGNQVEADETCATGEEEFHRDEIRVAPGGLDRS